MFNLLKAELKALFKWKATIYTIIMMTLFGAFMTLINILTKASTFEGFFEFTYVVFLITSVTVGLFLHKDYSQNTIRNKIIVGHSRGEIYLAKIITIFIAISLVMILFIIAAVSVGCIFGDVDYIKWGIFGQNCVMVWISLINVVSIISILSINIQSTIGAMLPMIVLYIIMFFGIIVVEMFVIKNNTTALELVKTLPVVSVMMLNETIEPFKISHTIIWGIGITLCMQFLGYYIFRKLDLK